ncbi:hypothetical protein SAMN04488057_11421 [Cyclobacterium lianum]|uniref:Uncharacterized protein n=1 Tax=Cyclobacterium lianum TaxID=388280 RepID=A0A1M7Q506_9BACT|nr:hypothetical protein [Cyclobacterium lianum]SHN25416.1 hypothetical protein SAMN04488057_11421 [Cyclobacterium lianum]
MAVYKILDQAYIDRYSGDFSRKICDEYFTDRQYIGGQEIIQLTACSQLNLMVIKILFESWQEQMDTMARNPYFDYGDHAVKEALVRFMNTLSRAIKIRREDFEPLLEKALSLTLHLGADPVGFFLQDWDEPEGKPGGYFKEQKKYIKWHVPVWQSVASALAENPETPRWEEELQDSFEKNSSTLSSAHSLFEPLNEKVPIDPNKMWTDKKVAPWEENAHEPAADPVAEPTDAEQPEVDEPDKGEGTVATEIDPALAWAKFESEEYTYMKGSVRNLRESLGINQRIMFTKRLFQGNQDLLDQAMDELDQADSFFDAVNLMNQSFVQPLKWDASSDEVQELLQLLFRKFDGEED